MVTEVFQGIKKLDDGTVLILIVLDYGHWDVEDYDKE